MIQYIEVDILQTLKIESEVFHSTPFNTNLNKFETGENLNRSKTMKFKQHLSCDKSKAAYIFCVGLLKFQAVIEQ